MNKSRTIERFSSSLNRPHGTSLAVRTHQLLGGPWCPLSILKSISFPSLGLTEPRHLHASLPFSLSEGWVVRVQTDSGKSRGFLKPHNPCSALCPVQKVFLGRLSWALTPLSVMAKEPQPKNTRTWVRWWQLLLRSSVISLVISVIRNCTSGCLKHSARSNQPLQWQHILAPLTKLVTNFC